MNFESCGAGMQTTALTLMSCENALHDWPVYPLAPVYDGVFFADLGCEPAWVYDQVEFLSRACGKSGIPFYVIRTDLYGHYMRNFGKARVVSIPFWSVDEDGKKGKMMRNCTLDFKIKVIQKFIKFNLLGYRMDGDKRTRDEDRKAHTMHIGFSAEEAQRIFDNPHPMFINQFPLKEMGWVRSDSYFSFDICSGITQLTMPLPWPLMSFWSRNRQIPKFAASCISPAPGSAWPN